MTGHHIQGKTLVKEDEMEGHTARPTAPNPKTATVEPFLGFATFRVEPNPVE